ncbi:MAG: hypothetical protein PVH91_07475 [Pseudomonadales bacterium]|jgi:hypothetical protein
MQLDATLAMLLGLAANLSGYPLPPEPPHVRFEDHAFFEATVCRADPCRVVGFYDDAGTIYLDRRFSGLDDEIGSSLLIHELTHYLQERSGAFASGSCAQNVAREREAYRVQNRYITDVLGSDAVIKVPDIPCSYPNPPRG